MEGDERKPSSSGGAKRNRTRSRSRGKSHDDTSQSKQKSADEQQHRDSGDGFLGFVDPRKTNTTQHSRQNTAGPNQRKQSVRRKLNGMEDTQNDRRAPAASAISPERRLIEKGMLKTLLRWKEKERGMIKSAGNRYKEIARKCKKPMHLPQALSLRRQHIQHMNPGFRMRTLGLGNEEDIRQSAALFETSVESYMTQCNVPFLTEKHQKQRLPKGVPSPATPDFLLLEPTLLSTIMPSYPGQEPETSEYVIHWVEAKMFYGASTIARDSESAVGRLLATSEKYCKLYGTGAMVFMYGCGKELAQWLLQLGVVALDAHPLDLRQVKNHQRTWCANENGLILP